MLSRRVSELIRQVSSCAPLVGLVARPEARPNAISALVRVKGDEEWIEPSLLSIREFADEILVLDNGASAQTQTILDQLRAALGKRLAIERCPQLDLFQVSNLGLARARSRWVIRWDADFVAHTSGPGDIQHLRHYLLGLNPRLYYLVYLPAAEVAGDLCHQFPDLRIRHDGQVHTASHWAQYVPVHRKLSATMVASPDRIFRTGRSFQITKESLRVPKFYRVLRWKQVSYFHVNVKSARHTLMRHFWLEWLGRSDFRTFPTLESYMRTQIGERLGSTDPTEAASRFMTQYSKQLAPFDADRCGSHPALLQAFLAKPKYRVEYRDGQIIGRSEVS